MEHEIALIWADVLGVEAIGPQASFYEFGGTSLQAMRICARVETATGAAVTPDLLFESDTFADFVTAVADAAGTGADG